MNLQKKSWEQQVKLFINLIKNVASHHSMSSYLELSFENDRRAYRQYPQAWWAHAYIGVFLGDLRKLSCPKWGYFYFAQTFKDHNQLIMHSVQKISECVCWLFPKFYVKSILKS